MSVSSFCMHFLSLCSYYIYTRKKYINKKCNNIRNKMFCIERTVGLDDLTGLIQPCDSMITQQRTQGNWLSLVL